MESNFIFASEYVYTDMLFIDDSYHKYHLFAWIYAGVAL